MNTAAAPLASQDCELAHCVSRSVRLTSDTLALPFDMTRSAYARAVQAGLIERSMLASRDFARWLGALEQLTLGPWARRV